MPDPQRSLQELLNTNFGSIPADLAGYVGSQGSAGYVGSAGVNGTIGTLGYTGSAGANGTSAEPSITSIAYPGDDTATNTAGGDTVTVTGSNFVAGATVVINKVQASVVSVVNSTTITFTAPAMGAGSYIVYVVNPDGGTALAVPGIQYSGTPTWTTAAGSLGSVNKQTSFTANLSATGDAPISYSITSGTLPAGLTLTANTGVVSGTTPDVASSTTYNFTVRATDAQQQDTDRAFNITVVPRNTPSTIEYLVVAGGGAGTYAGGGAGGLLTGTTSVAGGTQYTVTVGASASDSVFGSNVIVAKRGGGGGQDGGSGGGSTQRPGYSPIGRGIYPGSSYIDAPRQGYDGAYGQDGVTSYTAGGGGGGAGGPGQTGSGFNGGYGGIGVASSISGTSLYYAGGGAGGTNKAGGNGGAGGAGGGGDGGYAPGADPYGTAGMANTGGGGGSNATGGSGIVIVRYADTYEAAAATTGSPTVTVAGGYRIYIFTSSGSITL